MKKLILLSIMLLTITSLALADITGSETMDRQVPATSEGNFQITYVVEGASGKWGVSIEDSVSGGCTFPSGDNTYRSVMLSEDGNTKTITITAPEDGTCTFSGDYKFGTESITQLTDDSITIGSGVCTPDCEGKVCGSNGCGGSCGTCASDETCESNQCVEGGEPEPKKCDFWEKEVDGECQINTTLIIAGIALLIVFVFLSKS